jgi:hypothetical protein
MLGTFSLVMARRSRSMMTTWWRSRSVMTRWHGMMMTHMIQASEISTFRAGARCEPHIPERMVVTIITMAWSETVVSTCRDSEYERCDE